MSEVRFGENDRSLGELFSDLGHELGTLVRQELNLAKTEMTQKAARAGRHAGMVVAGGAVGYAGLLAVVAAVILLLARAMPAWGAALLVGVVVAGIGGAMAYAGLNGLKNEDPMPRETVETLKEDARWVQAQTRQRG